MPAPTAHSPDIDRTRSHVTQPDRTVTIGGTTFPGGDVDIRISHDGRVATIKTAHWNLTQGTFTDISVGDKIEVRVGWNDATSDRVVDGRVTGKKAKPSRRGADHKYVVTARSEGAVAVRERITASWSEASVNTIIRDIAAKLGLEVGHLGPPATSDKPTAAPRLASYWQIRSTRRVRAWLDELARAASKETGHQFEWYIDRGALSFHPKRYLPDTEVRLTTADEVIELQPYAGKTTQTNAAEPNRLLGYATPTIQKQATIRLAHTTGGKAPRQAGNVLDQPDPTGEELQRATQQYRVARYRFETGTTIGHHQFSAVIVPDHAQYRYRPAGSTAGSGSGSGSGGASR